MLNERLEKSCVNYNSEIAESLTQNVAHGFLQRQVN